MACSILNCAAESFCEGGRRLRGAAGTTFRRGSPGWPRSFSRSWGAAPTMTHTECFRPFLEQSETVPTGPYLNFNELQKSYSIVRTALRSEQTEPKGKLCRLVSSYETVCSRVPRWSHPL